MSIGISSTFRQHKLLIGTAISALSITNLAQHIKEKNVKHHAMIAGISLSQTVEIGAVLCNSAKALSAKNLVLTGVSLACFNSIAFPLGQSAHSDLKVSRDISFLAKLDKYLQEGLPMYGREGSQLGLAIWAKDQSVCCDKQKGLSQFRIGSMLGFWALSAPCQHYLNTNLEKAYNLTAKQMSRIDTIGDALIGLSVFFIGQSKTPTQVLNSLKYCNNTRLRCGIIPFAIHNEMTGRESLLYEDI